MAYSVFSTSDNIYAGILLVNPRGHYCRHIYGKLELRIRKSFENMGPEHVLGSPFASWDEEINKT